MLRRHTGRVEPHEQVIRDHAATVFIALDEKDHGDGATIFGAFATLEAAQLSIESHGVEPRRRDDYCYRVYKYRGEAAIDLWSWWGPGSDWSHPAPNADY